MMEWQAVSELGVEDRAGLALWLYEGGTSKWSEEPHHVVTTYVTFSSRLHLHCGLAFQHFLLFSESTEGHCPTGFHGPRRKKEEISVNMFFGNTPKSALTRSTDNSD